MSALFKILLILKLLFVSCLNVNFRENYNAEMEQFNTQIFKREMSHFFDKASYTFNGFKKIESIPVLFPIDICLLKLENTKYATSLYTNRAGVRHFAVFKMNNGSYISIADLAMPHAIAMDCIGFGIKGYIAIAFNISQPVENARDGSPVYELKDNRLRPIQYFSAANLFNIYLRVQGNNIMLLQSFRNSKSLPNLHCPYFRWSGSTFSPVGRIPCSNAHHLEPFSIDHENYVAVANYADQQGRTSTYSEIYKFLSDKKKFQLHQKIKTNGAVDVRYFKVPLDEFRYQHFIVFGNSLSDKNNVKDIKDEHTRKNYEADSIFYIYEKGQFLPYQRLTLYAVKQFLPIQNIDAEKFLLLVSSENQDIKIYNLNDWKFEESTAQFTEGALGKGVARMRIFQDQEESFLVIANELMTANEANIFSPIFKQEEHANALRQQIIDWTKTNMERLKRINAEKLKRDVEAKLLKDQSQHVIRNPKINVIPKANVDTVITQSLISNKLHLRSNYWKALEFTNRALTALEEQYKPHQPKKRELRNHTLETHYNFERIDVGTLQIRNKLTAKSVNNVSNNNPIFESIRSKRIIVTGKYTGPKDGFTDYDNLVNTDDSQSTLHIQRLTTYGKLNGNSWNDLLNNTLKRKGSQVIKANITIGELQSKKLTVERDEVCGTNLGNLVPIDGGNFIVAQDVLFEAPVTAKYVVIRDRLNQISVHQLKLDVLLKRYNKTQVVLGPKRLKSLHVLQPITVSGSLSSSHLRAISPSKAIHDNLVLHGDYVIDGDVIITKFLNTNDLLDFRTNTSAFGTLSNGLHIGVPLENINIAFESPVKAKNSTVSFINTKDMQGLIKTNTHIPQVISGLKVFKNGLSIINGFSEVKTLNGFDVENLEKRLLLKDANQTITAPLHVGRILSRSIKASNLRLSNNTMATFLTKSENQQVNGTLRVNTLDVGAFQVYNLNTNGKIFDIQLTDIYEYKSKKIPKNKIFQKQQKFLGAVYIKNLWINDTLNNKSITDFEHKLKQLNGNVKYVGNFKVNYNMDVANLTFNGQFNGISAKEFGNCWLRKTTEQTFTAIQTFALTEFVNGATLTGKLNGFGIKDFTENAYWINRAEFLKFATFLNPVEQQMPLKTKTINKLVVPDDIFYRKSEIVQLIQSPLLIEGDLKIQGFILNTSFVNNIELKKLETYLRSSDIDTTLFLEHANFSYPPTYLSLNKNDLKRTLDAVWLANENIELLNKVEISEGYFEGLLDFEGPINDMNLKYLKQNYMSKSKPQVISPEIILPRNISLQSNAQVDEINLRGLLIDPESQSILNFDEFAKNSMKIRAQQEVCGNWSILKAVLAGDIHHTVFNELNLAAEVVRLNVKNIITAKKTMETSTIEKIYTTQGSSINSVDVSSWVRDTVFPEKNQTIYGFTTLSNANIGDLNVAGFVNNKPYDGNHLLLKDQAQTIYGTFKLRNKFPMEQRIVANNIKNLYVDKINGFFVDALLKNLTKRTAEDFLRERTLNSHLIFEQPLFIKEYASKFQDETIKRKRHLKYSTSDKPEMFLVNLEKATQSLSTAVKEITAVPYDFELHQVLSVNATRLIPFTIRLPGEIISVIGAKNESKQQSAVKLYYWDDKERLFALSDTYLSWLPQDAAALDMIKVIFGTDYVTLQRPKNGEILKKNIISSYGFKEMLTLTSEKSQMLEPLKWQQKDCFALYSKNGTRNVFIFCFNLSIRNSTLNLYKAYEIDQHANQVLSLSDTQVAMLVENKIGIWNSNENFKLQQILNSITCAKQMTTGRIDGTIYLAVISSNKQSKLIAPMIEIYSNLSIGFTHYQTLELEFEPIQIEFSVLEASQDLFLYVRNNIRPLLIYQLKGVMGFQLITGPKTLLKTSHHMQIIDLKATNSQLIALFEADCISFVKFKLKVL